MAPRDPQKPSSLMSGDSPDDSSYDLESNSSRSESQNQSPSQNLDHEYSIPSAVKFTWLGTYFLFSLMLTIYNKLVLGVVRF